MRREYVFPIKDERKLAYAAMNGMLADLRDQPYQDRYSRFMEPTDYRGFLDENEGHFGGIGAELSMREESLRSPDRPRGPQERQGGREEQA